MNAADHRHTPTRLLATAATGLALAAGLLAGCGSDSDEPAATAAAAATQPAQTAPATAPAVTTTAVETTPAAAPEPGIVTAEASANGVRFRFVLTELRRSGPTVIANARLEHVSGEERLQISDTFDDGQYQELKGESGDELGHVFDGIALIDPEGRKKYLVARDETGRCVCSNDLSAVFLRADSPVTLQATLAAPPEDVTEVDVVVPNVKTFSDVPISG